MSGRCYLIAFVVLVVATGRADAYPHFQLTTGSSQCSQCHVGPAGGGLLTPWGQDEFGDTIASGGDGSFLHGAITMPKWLQIGGNIRLAALTNDVGSSDGAEIAVFPMQLDLTLRVASGAWSVVGTVGVRGRVRSGAPDTMNNPASEVSSPSLASYVISREHYVMWRPEQTGAYARAGRYAAPYGLRLADHTAYVRRYLGFNLLEETYNLGGGWIGEDWEVHATAFAYDPLQGAARKDFGGAAMFEKQATAKLIVGASGRAGIASNNTRLQAGVHGKLWLEDAKLLFQTEVHGVREMFEGGEGNRWQLAAYSGPVFVPIQGIYTGVGYQAFAQDLKVRSVTRHSGDAWISYFPRAHFEVMLSARAQWVGPAERAYLGLLQLHYAL
ncbi:MAG: hypothetical protein H0T46_04495 [Deltaproteobacteria bacterium]|nr:hypothetical protein [Deltaproteobacteria bacterium]